MPCADVELVAALCGVYSCTGWICFADATDHSSFLSVLNCCCYCRWQAYDQHLNMILGEVEETVTSTELDEETDEEIVKKQTRKVGMLFVRGDIVVLVSPPLRTA